MGDVPGGGPGVDAAGVPIGMGPGPFGGAGVGPEGVGGGGRAGLGGRMGSGGGLADPEGGWSGGNPRNVLVGDGSEGGGRGRSTAGVPVDEEEAARGGAAAAAAEERAGASGVGGMAGRGRKDEDQEHKSKPYLQNNDLDQLITGDLPRTITPTIGETDR